MKAASILVLGSLNVDYTLRVTSLPCPGETIYAKSLQREFGGKGGNLAIAAARQGANVTLVSAIAEDAIGVEYLQHLGSSSINTDFIEKINNASTGTAHICVDDNGENMIIVTSGANALISEKTLLSALRTVKPDVVVCQFEVSISLITKTLQQCNLQKIPVILNPSPINRKFRWGKFPLFTVVVNEVEMPQWFNYLPEAFCELNPPARAEILEHYKIAHLILTRGAKSTLHFHEDKWMEIPALKVNPLDIVDTVGAGDTFTGVLSVALAERCSWQEAITKANIAGALATQKHGAQQAIPTRKIIEKYTDSLLSEMHSRPL